jgi:hypothetical protein
MTSRRLAASSCVIAAGGIVLSGCGGDKPSGLASFTPGASSGSSPAAPKWTPGQQEGINASLLYDGLVAKYSRGQMVNRAELRTAATESRAVGAEKEISGGFAMGFILHGPADEHQIRSVTITGAESTLTECWIGHSYGVRKAASPPETAKAAAPTILTIKLTRSADKWRLSALTEGAAGAAKG